MYALPVSVNSQDTIFHIRNNGDFRMVLDCFSALQDEEMSEDNRVLASLIIFYNELNSLTDISENEVHLEKLIKEMFHFINTGQESAPGADGGVSLVDWERDASIISAAINNVAKQEIRAVEYMHWWTFLGYYLSIGQSVFATVVSIREKIIKKKKLEKWEQEFRRENPAFFIWRSSSVTDRSAEKIIQDIWNKGG